MPKSKVEMLMDKAKAGKRVHALCLAGDCALTMFDRPADERFDLLVDLGRVLEAATQGKFSLMSELNDLQSDDSGDTLFANKSDIPLRIVNLVLKPYNFVVKEY